MENHKWRLYESGRRFSSDEVRIEGSPDFSFQLERLSGGLSDGVDLLTINNGPLAIKLLPTRGMGVWDMTYDGVRIGWQSPVPGPVHPCYVNLADPSGLGWLDGFDELLVRCGLESNGAPEFYSNGQLRWPVHGRIANLPARTVDVEFDPHEQALSVTGIVDEVRFHFAKLRLTATLTTKIGQKGFALRDVVENRSEAPAEAQLLYHVNIGLPLLDAGSKLLAPVREIAPRDAFSAKTVETWNQVEPPGTSLTETAYYFEMYPADEPLSAVMLHDQAAARGVRLAYDAQTLPCFTFWKNPRAVSDGYVVGLEPASNFPNPTTFEKQQGRAFKLPPYGSVECRLQIDYCSIPDEVKSAAEAIQSQSRGQGPTVHQQPRAQWSQSG